MHVIAGKAVCFKEALSDDDEEEEVEILSDLYSTNREVTMETEEACFDKILAKNACKCKIVEKIQLDNGERILQICHSTGEVKLDAAERRRTDFIWKEFWRWAFST